MEFKVDSEEKSFEIVDRRRRTSETAYHISSLAAFGPGDLKIKAKDSQMVGYKEK